MTSLQRRAFILPVSKQFYDPPDVFSPVNIYSHAVGCGRTLTLAGQAPLNDDGTVVGPGNPEAQCRRVFADLEKTLDLAGATFEHVVYVRAYLTDKSLLPVLRRLACGIFVTNRPAFTVVVIPSCRGEGVMVEIELVVELARPST
jgi:enamine deaminase RidA (YjgF/YER057c/UK114 family)